MPCNADLIAPIMLPSDPFSDIISTVQSRLQQLTHKHSLNHIAVAVSGGADSLALTLILHQISKQLSFKITALTIDHGLRVASKEEADYVHDLLSKHSIPHHTLRWQGEIPTSNRQAVARKIRYELLTEWCCKHEVDYLATAHHQDDQAETVLMRLLRGSGVKGLAAIRPVTVMHEATVIRPCLDIKKKELIDYLLHHEIQWIEDPSNQHTDYDRSHIRHFLSDHSNGLPIDQSLLVQRLCQTASHMQRVEDALLLQQRQFIHQSVTVHPAGYLTLNREALFNTPEEIGLRVLSLLLCVISGNDQIPRFTSIESLYHTCISKQPIDTTLHGCRIYEAKNKHQSGIIYCSPERYGDTITAMKLEQNPALFANRLRIIPIEKKNKYTVQYLNKTLYNQLDESIRTWIGKVPAHIRDCFPCIISKHNRLIQIANRAIDTEARGLSCIIELKNRTMMTI